MGAHRRRSILLLPPPGTKYSNTSYIRHLNQCNLNPKNIMKSLESETHKPLLKSFTDILYGRSTRIPSARSRLSCQGSRWPWCSRRCVLVTGDWTQGKLVRVFWPTNSQGQLVELLLVMRELVLDLCVCVRVVGGDVWHFDWHHVPTHFIVQKSVF